MVSFTQLLVAFVAITAAAALPVERSVPGVVRGSGGDSDSIAEIIAAINAITGGGKDSSGR
ncbi:hypothetical protein FA95DRAFT_1612199 [Auriscalpium vulgare]|uniref:Uncharacterized protein n=1 Tax=Auriscalpium vulgare TaxID=40419 RepID=A0ACB8R724_9AGAM|nr:hypothetical protein FA95DRAFT_1612199 [Auriscalpium vulgare]